MGGLRLLELVFKVRLIGQEFLPAVNEVLSLLSSREDRIDLFRQVVNVFVQVADAFF